VTATSPGVLTVPGAPVPMSRLVLGTMTFGDTVDAAGAAAMLDAALDAGITGVDTANGYAGGETERILGPLLATRRDRVLLATKAGMPHPDAGDSAPLSAAGLRASLEGSLRRMAVDRVDLFYLHQPDRATPLVETLTAVKDAMDRGEVGALGVSNFAAWQIAELNHTADEVGAPRPVVAQQLYNLVARRLEEEYFEFATTTGLQTMVYNPLGGGLLSGRHSFGERPTAGRFGDSRLAAMYTERYWNPQLFAAIDTLAGIAHQAGLPLSELALRWLLGQDRVSSVLLGGSKVSHLQANLAAAARGPLPDDVVKACAEVGDTLRGPMPTYNR
jgi:aryl-alcohol dehydrogenase-like predicted oxidoreductase